MLNEKKKVFKEGSKEDIKNVQKKVKERIKECRAQYKEKLEENFKSNDMKEVWKGLKTIVGYSKKEGSIHISNGNYVNELNTFYARFDCHNFSENITSLINDISRDNSDPLPSVKECDVKQVFSSLKKNKACGPDNITSNTLKSCSKQLAPVFTSIFNKSLLSKDIPQIWKT